MAEDQSAQTFGYGASELIREAKRLGLSWDMRAGTVTASGLVKLDGDTGSDAEGVTVVSLVGPLNVPDARVMVIVVPRGGNFVIGGVTSTPGPQGVIASVSRDTSSTAAAGAQGVLRLDDVELLRNRRYRVRTNNFLLFSTVAGDTGSARLSFTDNGSAAGTGSSLLTIWNSSAIATVGGGTGGILEVDITPDHNFSLSVLLFTIRVSGTGNISIFASSTVIPLQLMVEDLGAVRTTTAISTII